MAKKHRIRKPGVVPCTRRRHAENARRTEHQVTGETPFAFARKACPRDGMISEFGCFLPFRASRLTKAPTKEGNPEHDAPSKEPKRLFRMQKPRKACSEGEGRTERRRRRRSRGADREAKAKAHRRQQAPTSARRAKWLRKQHRPRGEAACAWTSETRRTVGVGVSTSHTLRRLLSCVKNNIPAFSNVSRETFVRLPATPHGAPRELVQPCRRAERGPCAFCRICA